MTAFISLNPFPDLFLWKKDKNHFNFVEITDACARLFGFKDSAHAIGKSDYEIPSALSQFADVFRENDRQVIQQEKKMTFLEIQPCVNDEWKIFHVVKQPAYENNQVTGIMGYCVDITKTYMRLDQFITGNKKRVSRQKHIVNSKNPLTARESECLFFLLRRCSAKEIAGMLNLSPRTVEHYIEILKDKFGCQNKKGLVDTAKQLGYFNFIPSTILQKQISLLLE